MAQFKIYSSSAGSGKTYTLTRSYLRLVLSQPKATYLRNVLAITFTNDAANEMKSRILAALREFGREDFNESSRFWGMFREISYDILAETGEAVSDEILQERSRAVFYQIIHEYADFSVKTIDSFVNQLVSAFTDDLGLPFNYEIVLDKSGVMTEAVERLLTQVGDEKERELSRVLEKFALEKAEEGRSWNNMPQELANFGSDLLNDQHYSLIAKLDELTIADFRQIRSNIQRYMTWLENDLAERAKKIRELIEGQGLSMDDFSYKKAGVGGFLFSVENEVFKPAGKRVEAALENDDWFGKKPPAALIAMFQPIATEVVSQLTDFLEFRSKHEAKYSLLSQIRKGMYQLSLLKKIKTEFDAVLTEKNQVFIAEFNRRILQIVLNEPVPFIYERLGEKFNHILIDEFQDTSDMQFYNLLPLIENSLAANHFNLVVGDAKQAIYRWRGGKMELIVHLFGKNPEPLLHSPLISIFQAEQLATAYRFIEPVSLTTNFRSATEIIDFNNAFFRHILATYGDDFPLLAAAYQTFEQQQRPDAPTGGHVEVSILPNDKTLQTTLQAVGDYVRQVLAEGYALGDIAILCRLKKQSAAIAQYLNEQQIPVISQDSLLLNHSGAVRLVVAFLKVIDQPDNRLAKYEAAYLFYQYRLRNIPDTAANDAITAVVEADDVNEFYAFFEGLGYAFAPFQWQKAGVYATCEQLVRTLRLFDETPELPYIFGFLDIALDYGSRQSNHLHDFLLFWEEKKATHSIATAADADAVTITTIHRAKGLEYPIVIVPFADWNTGFKPNSTMWVDLEEVNYQEFVAENNGQTKRMRAASVLATKKLLDTEVEEQYADEEAALFIENLNLLYVAFTRPTDKLFILTTHPPERNNGDGNVRKLLQDFLAANEKTVTVSADEAESVILYEGRFLKQTKAITPEPIFQLNNIISRDRGDRLRLRRTSEKIFDPETLEKTKDHGNKVHAAFALVKTPKDVDEAIRQLEFAGIINASEGNEIKSAMERVMALPELAPLFAESVTVLNEKDILVKGRETLRPDRVVLTPDAVHILDFKTGAPRESHREQIRRYGRLYGEMGYEQVYMRLVYLETNESVAVA